MPSAAARLRGKLMFSLAWTFGRVGRAALQPLSVRAASKRPWHGDVTPAIRRALLFLRDVIRQLPPRVLRMDLPLRPPVLVWTDASCAPEEATAEGGFVIVVPAEGKRRQRVLWAADETEPAVLQRFLAGSGQPIMPLELLYAVAPYYSVPDVFAGRQVIHFIDNTGACASMVKGYARAIDAGLVVNAFHAWNAGLRADVFFEYVRSAANIADLPSRGARAELLALLRDMGMQATEVACKLPQFSTWDAPAREWMAEAAAVKRRRAGSEGGRAGKKARASHNARDSSCD